MSKMKNPIAATMEHMMPVGTIIEWCPVEGSGVDLSTPEKVRAYYGFGTWEAYGVGRFLLSVDDSAMVGTEGGEATHTLTVDEMPAHAHGFSINAGSPAKKGEVAAGTFSDYAWWEETREVGDTGWTGNNQPHNNMPPYISVYRWRRIA